MFDIAEFTRGDARAKGHAQHRVPSSRGGHSYRPWKVRPERRRLPSPEIVPDGGSVLRGDGGSAGRCDGTQRKRARLCMTQFYRILVKEQIMASLVSVTVRNRKESLRRFLLYFSGVCNN